MSSSIELDRVRLGALTQTLPNSKAIVLKQIEASWSIVSQRYPSPLADLHLGFLADNATLISLQSLNGNDKVMMKIIEAEVAGMEQGKEMTKTLGSVLKLWIMYLRTRPMNILGLLRKVLRRMIEVFKKENFSDCSNAAFALGIAVALLIISINDDDLEFSKFLFHFCSLPKFGKYILLNRDVAQSILLIIKSKSEKLSYFTELITNLVESPDLQQQQVCLSFYASLIKVVNKDQFKNWLISFVPYLMKRKLSCPILVITTLVGCCINKESRGAYDCTIALKESLNISLSDNLFQASESYNSLSILFPYCSAIVAPELLIHVIYTSLFVNYLDFSLFLPACLLDLNTIHVVAPSNDVNSRISSHLNSPLLSLAPSLILTLKSALNMVSIYVVQEFLIKLEFRVEYFFDQWRNFVLNPTNINRNLIGKLQHTLFLSAALLFSPVAPSKSNVIALDPLQLPVTSESFLSNPQFKARALYIISLLEYARVEFSGYNSFLSYLLLDGSQEQRKDLISIYLKDHFYYPSMKQASVYGMNSIPINVSDTGMFRDYFHLGLLPEWIDFIDPADFSQFLFPLLFRHITTRLASINRRVFQSFMVSFTRKPDCFLEYLPLFFKNMLDNFPKPVVFQSVGISYLAIYNQLSNQPNLFLYLVNLLLSKFKSRLTKKYDREMFKLLFISLRWVHLDYLEFLISEIEFLLRSVNEKTRLDMLKAIHSNLSSNFDLVRKQSVLNWYLKISSTSYKWNSI